MLNNGESNLQVMIRKPSAPGARIRPTGARSILSHAGKPLPHLVVTFQISILTGKEVVMLANCTRFKEIVGISFVLLLAVTAFAQVLLGQTDATMNPLPLVQLETPRVAYNVYPPRSITVEFDNASIPVDLAGQGRLQLTGSFPQAGSKYGYGGVIANFCVYWTMWHPYGSTIYHFRPNPASSLMPAASPWTNYGLRLEIPDLSWSPSPAPSAFIIREADFNRSTPTKYALDPAVTVELGPQAMMGTQQFPNIAYINFPKAYLEWFRSTGEGRIRAGNIVLSSMGGYWDDTRVNVFHMGRFVIDLNTMTVGYVTNDLVEHPTLLKVTVDDTPGDVFYFEPDIWW